MDKIKKSCHYQLAKYVMGYYFLILVLSPLSIRASSCTVSTVSVNFGVYNVYTTTNTTSIGQVTVSCSPVNTPYTVALNGGLYGTIAQRKQKISSGSDMLLYNLYSNASMTVLWGDGSTNGTTVASSNSTPLNVYGKLPSLQNISIGNYSDSVSVTVTF